jgi:hyperosmotically inducible protein
MQMRTRGSRKNLFSNFKEIKMKYLNELKFIGISLLLIGGLAACSDPGPAETAGKNIDQTMDKAGDEISGAADKASVTISEQSNKTGIVIDDTQITTKVKAAIFAEPGLDTLQINVDTVNGVVTLSGSVDSMAHSDMAKALARNVSGVSKVNNQLIVNPN